MAISNLVLTRKIYSEETNGAHAHNRDRVPLRAAHILLTRQTKPAQRGENQNPKVPRRLLKANQESLSPFLFWRKLKNLKA